MAKFDVATMPYVEDAGVVPRNHSIAPMTDQADPTARRFSVLEIRRAIAHHRRAIQALHDQNAFQGIHASTAAELVHKLERDLRRLEDELGRARLSALGDRAAHKTMPFPQAVEDVTLSPLSAR